jgi:hypothetical protein
MGEIEKKHERKVGGADELQQYDLKVSPVYFPLESISCYS